ALVAGVGPHEGAVGTDVAAHQPFRHGPFHRLVEQAFQHAGLVEAPSAILAERGGVPGLLIEVQADEPAQGHVAVQLHDELPVAGHPEQITAHQRQEQLLRWDRGPADRRVEISAGPTNRAIVDEWADSPQRMVVGHEGFQRDVVEERPLRIALSDHSGAPPLPHTTATRERRDQENLREFILSAAWLVVGSCMTSGGQQLIVWNGPAYREPWQ